MKNANLLVEIKLMCASKLGIILGLDKLSGNVTTIDRNRISLLQLGKRMLPELYIIQITKKCISHFKCNSRTNRVSKRSHNNLYICVATQ